MDGHTEKRLLERYRVDLGVVCRSKGQEHPGRALNLSRGGVLVATGSLVPVGTLTEVILAMAGAEVLQFKGIVRFLSSFFAKFFCKKLGVCLQPTSFN